MLINEPAVVAEVEAVFAAYEQALMDNDLDALDAMFWPSPLTVRLSPSESLYGIDAIRAFRQNRLGGSPQRSVTKVVIATFGDSLATVNAEFLRIDSTSTGRQSQTWVRFEEGWRVVSAHISFLG